MKNTKKKRKAHEPNAETIAALQEAERISRDPNVKKYKDVEEALRILKEPEQES